MHPLRPSDVAVGAAVAMAALLAFRFRVDLAADKQLCDTTYLYEGYQREELPSNFAERFPRYSLIRFVDRDPKLAAVERPAHSVPVVFVHGHLGSHQQMRSLASETGRELRRRLEARDAGAGGGEARADEALHAPFWLDWLAPDFDAQPSALEPALVAQQAEFLAGCMRHLRERHLAGPAAGAPFRLALVAYSMGGHVARLALRRLAADPGSAGLLPEVVLLLQLASPQHVPGFVRPMPLQPAPMHPSWSAAAAAADAAAIPTVTVLAGRSDHMISHSRALAPLLAPGELAVGMEDVPGVWTSASHKRAVACNQLVRRLAPLLVDAALLAVADARDGGGSTAAAGKADQRGNAAVATAVMARAAAGLATNAAAALGLAAPGGNGACGAEVGQEQRQGREELRVDEEFTVARLPPGRSVLNLSWQPGGLHAAGTTGVLLLTSGARPCAQLRVAAPGRQAAAAAAPLPPLLPGRQARHVPRRWDELVEGVDWLANATWLLCVPFSKGGLPSNGSVRVTLTAAQKLGGSNGSGSSGTAEPVLLAQVLPSHPACSPGRELQYPGGPALLLPRGHPALLRLRAPAWPGRDSSPLARLLLGGSPVWSLRVQAVACHGGRLPAAHRQSEEPQEEEAGGVEFLQPAVLAVSSDSSGGDGPAPQHSIPRPTAPAVHWADTVRLLPPGGGGVPLWELGGGAGAPDPLLLLVSDPRCSYAVSLAWSPGGWVSHALRLHVYALPSLAIAAAVCQLGCGSATSFVLPLLAAAAAWGSQQPQQAQRLTGLQPWAELCAAEAAALVAAGWGVAVATRAVVAGWVRGLRSVVWRRGQLPQARAWRVLALACVEASTLVHPTLPLLLALPVLAVRAAVSSSTGGSAVRASARRDTRAGTGSGADGSASSGVARGASGVAGSAEADWLDWLTAYMLLSLLPATQLAGWLANRRRYSYGWTEQALAVRMVVLLLAAHASTVCPASGRTASTPGPACGAALAAAAGAAAATAAGVAGVWGHPHVALPMVGTLAAADVVVTRLVGLAE